VTLLDVNILIYASDDRSREHGRIAAWLSSVFQGEEPVGLAWAVIWAFIRISTDRRLRSVPRSVATALDEAELLLIQPGVTIIEPGPRHFTILQDLIINCQASGALVSDAVLAALAIEHGATLASTDRDFSRFPNLKWVNPLQPA
jgi:uncharacterized protein